MTCIDTCWQVGQPTPHCVFMIIVIAPVYMYAGNTYIRHPESLQPTHPLIFSTWCCFSCCRSQFVSRPHWRRLRK